MKRYFVGELLPDDEIEDFFMVKSAEVRIGANKKAFFDIMLSDSSGDVNGKKWDLSEATRRNSARFELGT